MTSKVITPTKVKYRLINHSVCCDARDPDKVRFLMASGFKDSMGSLFGIDRDTTRGINVNVDYFVTAGYAGKLSVNAISDSTRYEVEVLLLLHHMMPATGKKTANNILNELGMSGSYAFFLRMTNYVDPSVMLVQQYKNSQIQVAYSQLTTLQHMTFAQYFSFEDDLGVIAAIEITCEESIEISGESGDELITFVNTKGINNETDLTHVCSLVPDSFVAVAYRTKVDVLKAGMIRAKRLPLEKSKKSAKFDMILKYLYVLNVSNEWSKCEEREKEERRTAINIAIFYLSSTKVNDEMSVVGTKMQMLTALDCIVQALGVFKKFDLSNIVSWRNYLIHNDSVASIMRVFERVKGYTYEMYWAHKNNFQYTTEGQKTNLSAILIAEGYHEQVESMQSMLKGVSALENTPDFYRWKSYGGEVVKDDVPDEGGAGGSSSSSSSFEHPASTQDSDLMMRYAKGTVDEKLIIYEVGWVYQTERKIKVEQEQWGPVIELANKMGIRIELELSIVGTENYHAMKREGEREWGIISDNLSMMRDALLRNPSLNASDIWAQRGLMMGSSKLYDSAAQVTDPHSVVSFSRSVDALINDLNNDSIGDRGYPQELLASICDEEAIDESLIDDNMFEHRLEFLSLVMEKAIKLRHTPYINYEPGESAEQFRDGVKEEFDKKDFVDLSSTDERPHDVHGYRRIVVEGELVKAISTNNLGPGTSGPFDRLLSEPMPKATQVEKVRLRKMIHVIHMLLLSKYRTSDDQSPMLYSDRFHAFRVVMVGGIDETTPSTRTWSLKLSSGSLAKSLVDWIWSVTDGPILVKSEREMITQSAESSRIRSSLGKLVTDEWEKSITFRTTLEKMLEEAISTTLQWEDHQAYRHWALMDAVRGAFGMDQSSRDHAEKELSKMYTTVRTKAELNELNAKEECSGADVVYDKTTILRYTSKVLDSMVPDDPTDVETKFYKGIILSDAIKDIILRSGVLSASVELVESITSELIKIPYFRNLLILSLVSEAFGSAMSNRQMKDKIVDNRVRGTTLRLVIQKHTKPGEAHKCAIVNNNQEIVMTLRMDRKKADLWSALPQMVVSDLMKAIQVKVAGSGSLAFVSHATFQVTAQWYMRLTEQTCDVIHGSSVDIESVSYDASGFYNYESSQLVMMRLAMGSLWVAHLRHQNTKENNTLASHMRYCQMMIMSHKANWNGLGKKGVNRFRSIVDQLESYWMLGSCAIGLASKQSKDISRQNCYLRGGAKFMQNMEIVGSMYTSHYYVKTDVGGPNGLLQAHKGYIEKALDYEIMLNESFDTRMMGVDSMPDLFDEWLSISESKDSDEEKDARSEHILDLASNIYVEIVIQDRDTPFYSRFLTDTAAEVYRRKLPKEAILTLSISRDLNQPITAIAEANSVVTNFKLNTNTDELASVLVNAKRTKASRLFTKGFKADGIKIGDAELFNMENLQHQVPEEVKELLSKLIQRKDRITPERVKSLFADLNFNSVVSCGKPMEMISFLQQCAKIVSEHNRNVARKDHITLGELRAKLSLDLDHYSWINEREKFDANMLGHPRASFSQLQPLVSQLEAFWSEMSVKKLDQLADSAEQVMVQYLTVIAANASQSIVHPAEARRRLMNAEIEVVADENYLTATLLTLIMSVVMCKETLYNGMQRRATDRLDLFRPEDNYTTTLKMGFEEIFIEMTGGKLLMSSPICEYVIKRFHTPTTFVEASSVDISRAETDLESIRTRILISQMQDEGDCIRWCFFTSVNAVMFDDVRSVAKGLPIIKGKLSIKSTRGKSLMEVAKLVTHTGSLMLSELALKFINNTGVKYQFGVAAKAQLMSHRELAILDMPTKLSMAFVERIAGHLLSFTPSDLLMKPRGKSDFMANCCELMKASHEYRNSFVSGDKSKWGPKQFYLNFKTTLNVILREHPLRRVICKQMIKGLHKKIEIPDVAIKSTYNKMLKRSAALCIGSMELKRKIDLLHSKLNETIFSDWLSFDPRALAGMLNTVENNHIHVQFRNGEFFDPLMDDLSSYSGAETVVMLQSTCRLSREQLWTLYNISQNKCSHTMIAHMNQGIPHRISSIMGNSAMLLGVELVKRIIGRQWPDKILQEYRPMGTGSVLGFDERCGLGIAFKTSSDDRGVILSATKDSYSQDEFKVVTDLAREVILYVETCCNMKESPKSVESSIAAELYSTFVVKGKVNTALIKFISGGYVPSAQPTPVQMHMEEVTRQEQIVDNAGTEADIICYSWLKNSAVQRGLGLTDKVTMTLSSCSAALNPYAIYSYGDLLDGEPAMLFLQKAWFNCMDASVLFRKECTMKSIRESCIKMSVAQKDDMCRVIASCIIDNEALKMDEELRFEQENNAGFKYRDEVSIKDRIKILKSRALDESRKMLLDQAKSTREAVSSASAVWRRKICVLLSRKGFTSDVTIELCRLAMAMTSPGLALRLSGINNNAGYSIARSHVRGHHLRIRDNKMTETMSTWESKTDSKNSNVVRVKFGNLRSQQRTVRKVFMDTMLKGPISAIGKLNATELEGVQDARELADKIKTATINEEKAADESENAISAGRFRVMAVDDMRVLTERQRKILLSLADNMQTQSQTDNNKAVAKSNVETWVSKTVNVKRMLEMEALREEIKLSQSEQDIKMRSIIANIAVDDSVAVMASLHTYLMMQPVDVPDKMTSLLQFVEMSNELARRCVHDNDPEAVALSALALSELSDTLEYRTMFMDHDALDVKYTNRSVTATSFSVVDLQEDDINLVRHYSSTRTTMLDNDWETVASYISDGHSLPYSRIDIRHPDLLPADSLKMNMVAGIFPEQAEGVSEEEHLRQRVAWLAKVESVYSLPMSSTRATYMVTGTKDIYGAAMQSYICMNLIRGSSIMTHAYDYNERKGVDMVKTDVQNLNTLMSMIGQSSSEGVVYLNRWLSLQQYVGSKTANSYLFSTPMPDGDHGTGFSANIKRHIFPDQTMSHLAESAKRTASEVKTYDGKLTATVVTNGHYINVNEKTGTIITSTEGTDMVTELTRAAFTLMHAERAGKSNKVTRAKVYNWSMSLHGYEKSRMDYSLTSSGFTPVQFKITVSGLRRLHVWPKTDDKYITIYFKALVGAEMQASKGVSDVCVGQSIDSKGLHFYLEVLNMPNYIIDTQLALQVQMTTAAGAGDEKEKFRSASRLLTRQSDTPMRFKLYRLPISTTLSVNSIHSMCSRLKMGPGKSSSIRKAVRKDRAIDPKLEWDRYNFDTVTSAVSGDRSDNQAVIPASLLPAVVRKMHSAGVLHSINAAKQDVRTSIRTAIKEEEAKSNSCLLYLIGYCLELMDCPTAASGLMAARDIFLENDKLIMANLKIVYGVDVEDQMRKGLIIEGVHVLASEGNVRRRKKVNRKSRSKVALFSRLIKGGEIVSVKLGSSIVNIAKRVDDYGCSKFSDRIFSAKVENRLAVGETIGGYIDFDKDVDNRLVTYVVRSCEFHQGKGYRMHEVLISSIILLGALLIEGREFSELAGFQTWTYLHDVSSSIKDLLCGLETQLFAKLNPGKGGRQSFMSRERQDEDYDERIAEERNQEAQVVDLLGADPFSSDSDG